VNDMATVYLLILFEILIYASSNGNKEFKEFSNQPSSQVHRNVAKMQSCRPQALKTQ
jgi:hypothetical protein